MSNNPSDWHDYEVLWKGYEGAYHKSRFFADSIAFAKKRARAHIRARRIKIYKVRRVGA